MPSIHYPVLLNEVIKFLNPQINQNFIDCTFGGGGHSVKILEKILPNGKLLAIDFDKDVLKNFDISAAKNLIFVNDNFRNLKKIVKENFNYPVHGILFDIGLSSDQLEKSGRGFSFQRDEPLDMRFDVNQDLIAAHILNSYSIKDLYALFKNFGEYPYAHQLSKIILEQRRLKKFTNTFDLVDVILSVHKRRHYEKIHPATKVFQALRIAVNNELENLKEVLPQAVEILQPGGRLIVISFHGLEDRIVKNYFRDLSRADEPVIKLLTKKPISPSDEEVKNNPRSRSAKMRVVEKI